MIQPYQLQVHNVFVIGGNAAVLRCTIPSFVQGLVQVTSWLKDEHLLGRTVIHPGDRYVLSVGRRLFWQEFHSLMTRGRNTCTLTKATYISYLTLLEIYHNYSPLSTMFYCCYSCFQTEFESVFQPTKHIAAGFLSWFCAPYRSSCTFVTNVGLLLEQ
jgi:hypothetical protein